MIIPIQGREFINQGSGIKRTRCSVYSVRCRGPYGLGGARYVMIEPKSKLLVSSYSSPLDNPLYNPPLIKEFKLRLIWCWCWWCLGSGGGSGGIGIGVSGRGGSRRHKQRMTLCCSSSSSSSSSSNQHLQDCRLSCPRFQRWHDLLLWRHPALHISVVV